MGVEPLAVQLGLQALQSNDTRELRSTSATLKRLTRAADTAGSIDAHLAVHRLLYLKSANAEHVATGRPADPL